MPTTGDVLPVPDPDFDRWRTQYVNKDTGAPNYPRIVGRLVSGLFQQAPATMTVADGETASMSDGQLADLTDRGVKRGAAESVVFIRPVEVAGQWQASLIGRSQVQPVWAHDTLSAATVWSVFEVGKAHQMLTEHYSSDQVTVQLWRVTKQAAGGWKLGTEVDTTEPEAGAVEPELHAEVRQLGSVARRLFAWAWDFEDGQPVPIHYTNEDLVDNLRDLNSVETEDTQLPRNIVAVSEESMAARRPGEDTSWGRLRGLRKGRNMLRVPSNQLAQNGTDSFIKHIRMEDDLTQAERIVLKENGFYEACGISPSTMGREVSGRSDSGDAKRADSQLTLTTIAGPARRWADTMTAVAAELARLGSGAAGPVQITEGLKTSAEERAELVSTQREADVQSIESGVAEINPDWEQDQIDEEVARIRSDNMIPPPLEF